MIYFILLLNFIFLCGCYYNPKALDRTPQPRKTAVKTVKNRPAAKNSSEDPLFDAVFKRKPQDMSDASVLSDKEKLLLQQSNISQDPTVREMHNRGQKSGNKRSDWVFGTKNGSYF